MSCRCLLGHSVNSTPAIHFLLVSMFCLVVVFLWFETLVLLLLQLLLGLLFASI